MKRVNNIRFMNTRSIKMKRSRENVGEVTWQVMRTLVREFKI